MNGYIDSHISERVNLSGLAMVKDENMGALSNVQIVFPLAVPNLVNNTGVAAKLKLVAANNSFAVSSRTIPAGKRCFASGTQGESYILYDENGVNLNLTLPLTGAGDAANTVAFAIDNFDGTVAPSTVRVCQAIIISAIAGDPYSSYYNLYAQSVTITQAHANWLNNISPLVPPPTDPYNAGGTSEPGGGEGTFEDESDGIDFPSKPTISAVDTGFLTIYIPTLQELTSLSRYLWNSDATTIDFWKKLVADPMDLILGLNMLPFEIESSGTKSVVVGLIDTDIDMQYTTDQYVEIDCGSIHIDKFWDAYLDSDPYTRFELYLPYCGTHPIMADEVTGKDIAVKFLVDILSGSCVASVKCGDNVLYQFAGNCAAQIPITANQFSDMVRSAISIASAIGTMVATSGATAPMGLTSIASTATNSSALKPAVEKSGAVSGMSGQLAIQTPYLIITRPRQCIPENQNKFIGYPSYVTMTLSDLTGFNVVSDIHFEGVPATSAELDELESIIKEGAIYG